MIADLTDRGVGALTLGTLGYLCEQGCTLAEIAEMAGVTRQAVHQRINGTPLDAARRGARSQRRDVSRFSRWRHRRPSGRRLATAVAEIRKHCPDLRVEWQHGGGTKSDCAWRVLVEGCPLSVRVARRVTEIGQAGWRTPVYRTALARAGTAYLMRTGDHRNFLFLAPAVPAYVWVQAGPPWRRCRTVAFDYEWRSGG